MNLSTKESSTSNTFMGYVLYVTQILETIHVRVDELTIMASKQNNLEPMPNKLNFEDPSAGSTQPPSKEDLENCFCPVFNKYFEGRSTEVLIVSAASNIPTNNDRPSSTTIIVDEDEALVIVSTLEEPTSSQSNDIADGQNQEENAHLEGNEFFNLFSTLSSEKAEFSFRMMLKCAHALTVSTTEPKNIIEALTDHNCIEAMQDENYQFARLHVWELVERPASRNVIGVK
ncbi:hypothetical protein Tco_1062286 [Tanacetum coccineum]